MNTVVLSERPSLFEPVLVVMLTGWIDASGAAGAAMQLLDTELNARSIALFDRDTFIDYRARRPVMELEEGVNARLQWPDIELKAGRDRDQHDVLLLTGHEPDAMWNKFAATVAELAADFRVTKMVAIGAYPFPAPHTRPSRLSITTPDPALAASLPYLRTTLSVPAGMASVLEHALHGNGIPSLGIWAQVPQYVASMSYPAATVALLAGLESVAGISVDASVPRSEAVLQRTRLDELVSGNAEHVAMVRGLEQVYDGVGDASPDGTSLSAPDHNSTTQTPLTLGELPTPDELAAEVERFLRDQGTAT